VVNPQGRDKGQLIAHVLFLKTPALMVYPSYAELIDYCSGFMLADLPWLNPYFGNSLSSVTQETPQPFRIFYISLSFASTYFLAFLTICAMSLLLGVVACVKESTRAVVKNIGLFLYNFFLGGLALAAWMNLQGAIINVLPEHTYKASLYILGFFVLVALLTEAVWSIRREKYNIFKARVLAKAALLSVLHLGPIYLFPIMLTV
jgi:hypothetical protein